VNFIFTQHARIAAEARKIQPDWVRITLEDPQLRTWDPEDSTIERFFRKIPENQNRILRVVVNTQVAPWRVVSVFFDRTMKGNL
jgi:hypothetical protein